MRKYPTSKILDKLHRGVVWTCMGVTAYGTFLIGMRVYRYFTVVRPQRQLEEFKMLEDEIVDKANLIDSAPKLQS
ncbi:CLUMA_CG000736, isoform A [Clunio marinus]|uniref:CLUMA_CG000736, isoform A n=1 Tax=Clunio marinus TaxID=568069 RepID=A0A1J1HGB4_9DIPT|nr:CLUMA_CG000736, isoform A [Clunio marinus]